MTKVKIGDSSQLFFMLALGLLLGAFYAVTYKMHFDIEQMLDRGVHFYKNR